MSSDRSRPFLKIVLDVLKEPMVYLLLGCAAVYFFLGDAQETAMLSSFLLLIAGLTIGQEARAERALEALQKMASPRALVFRDGQKIRISGREVVREDILFLNEGDRVSADGWPLHASHLLANESLLTGESLPVPKKEREMIYAGTTITHGEAIVFVSSTGPHTEIGRIGTSLQTELGEATQLEEQTRALVMTLTKGAVTLCVLVVVYYALSRQDWIHGLLTGLTLAMAILPNKIPAVLTIFFSLGAWRLSRKKILTRKMSAIENLGSTSVLCVDKTGTLTMNQMVIQAIYAHHKWVETDNVETLEEDFHETLEYGILASKKEAFDPMDLAFFKAGERFLKNTEHLHFNWDLNRIYPLSEKLLSISHAWKTTDQNITVIGAKGAPEAIMDLCHLDQDTGTQLAAVVHQMASRGYRVLGVAKAQTTQSVLPGQQHDFDFEFVGFVGLSDPVRPGVPEAIAQCHQAGIKVIMLTEDHQVTALTIAQKIGLQEHDAIVTGPEMESMSDEDLLHFLNRGRVFSRVMPAQKERLVLLEDDFVSIVEAVKTGRSIYHNIKNRLI